MAECWSCGAERRDDTFCGSCQKIQAPAPKQSFFEVLGLSPVMALEPPDVDAAFREASRRVHPDRFAQASAVERRLAIEHTARVNQAHRTLRDPQRRAEYLMELEGLKIGAEEARTKDPAFLMEMLELQESIDGATSADALARRKAELSARAEGLLSRLARYFDAREGTKDAAAAALDELRYLRRLGENVEKKLEEMG